jgi:hypothetical protein
MQDEYITFPKSHLSENGAQPNLIWRCLDYPQLLNLKFNSAQTILKKEFSSKHAS